MHSANGEPITIYLPDPVVRPAKEVRTVEIDQRKTPSSRATTLVLLGADVFAFGVVTALASAITSGFLFHQDGELRQQIMLWMPIPMTMLALMASGLYTQRVRHPSEELRLMGLVLSTVFLTFGLTVLVAGELSTANGLYTLLFWFLSLVTVPALRALTRVAFSRATWWGVATAVLVGNEDAARVVALLRRWPEMGIVPVAVLTDRPGPKEVLGVPVLGRWSIAPELGASKVARYALIVPRGAPHRQFANTISRFGKFYRRVFVLPELSESQTLWTTATDGVAGYTLWHPGLRRVGRTLKRLWDIGQSVLALFFLSPLLVVVALLIKLDSRGPVLFKQLRMGKGGRCFYVLKFRTMHVSAEDRLANLLGSDPALRDEYEQFHKLRDDPRVTRLGKILRVTCMDELPQLINVLRGEMSLVGPRAYMPQEISKMDCLERVILQERPGMTGLWQVSGRNDLTFDERLSMDVHYVHNWTLWLDLYITARTVPVLVLREGSVE